MSILLSKCHNQKQYVSVNKMFLEIYYLAHDL